MAAYHRGPSLLQSTENASISATTLAQTHTGLPGDTMPMSLDPSFSQKPGGPLRQQAVTSMPRERKSVKDKLSAFVGKLKIKRPPKDSAADLGGRPSGSKEEHSSAPMTSTVTRTISVDADQDAFLSRSRTELESYQQEQQVLTVRPLLSPPRTAEPQGTGNMQLQGSFESDWDEMGAHSSGLNHLANSTAQEHVQGSQAQAMTVLDMVQQGTVVDHAALERLARHAAQGMPESWGGTAEEEAGWSGPKLYMQAGLDTGVTLQASSVAHPSGSVVHPSGSVAHPSGSASGSGAAGGSGATHSLGLGGSGGSDKALWPATHAPRPPPIVPTSLSQPQDQTQPQGSSNRRLHPIPLAEHDQRVVPIGQAGGRLNSVMSNGTGSFPASPGSTSRVFVGGSATEEARDVRRKPSAAASLGQHDLARRVAAIQSQVAALTDEELLDPRNTHRLQLISSQASEAIGDSIPFPTSTGTLGGADIRGAGGGAQYVYEAGVDGSGQYGYEVQVTPWPGQPHMQAYESQQVYVDEGGMQQVFTSGWQTQGQGGYVAPPGHQGGYVEPVGDDRQGSWPAPVPLTMYGSQQSFGRVPPVPLQQQQRYGSQQLFTAGGISQQSLGGPSRSSGLAGWPGSSSSQVPGGPSQTPPSETQSSEVQQMYSGLVGVSSEQQGGFLGALQQGWLGGSRTLSPLPGQGSQSMQGIQSPMMRTMSSGAHSQSTAAGPPQGAGFMAHIAEQQEFQAGAMPGQPRGHSMDQAYAASSFNARGGSSANRLLNSNDTQSLDRASHATSAAHAHGSYRGPSSGFIPLTENENSDPLTHARFFQQGQPGQPMAGAGWSVPHQQSQLGQQGRPVGNAGPAPGLGWASPSPGTLSGPGWSVPNRPVPASRMSNNNSASSQQQQQQHVHGGMKQASGQAEVMSHHPASGQDGTAGRSGSHDLAGAANGARPGGPGTGSGRLPALSGPAPAPLVPPARATTQRPAADGPAPKFSIAAALNRFTSLAGSALTPAASGSSSTTSHPSSFSGPAPQAPTLSMASVTRHTPPLQAPAGPMQAPVKATPFSSGWPSPLPAPQQPGDPRPESRGGSTFARTSQSYDPIALGSGVLFVQSLHSTESITQGQLYAGSSLVPTPSGRTTSQRHPTWNAPMAPTPASNEQQAAINPAHAPPPAAEVDIPESTQQPAGSRLLARVKSGGLSFRRRRLSQVTFAEVASQMQEDEMREAVHAAVNNGKPSEMPRPAVRRVASSGLLRLRALHNGVRYRLAEANSGAAAAEAHRGVQSTRLPEQLAWARMQQAYASVPGIMLASGNNKDANRSQASNPTNSTNSHQPNQPNRHQDAGQLAGRGSVLQAMVDGAMTEAHGGAGNSEPGSRTRQHIPMFGQAAQPQLPLQQLAQAPASSQQQEPSPTPSLEQPAIPSFLRNSAAAFLQPGNVAFLHGGATNSSSSRTSNVPWLLDGPQSTGFLSTPTPAGAGLSNTGMSVAASAPYVGPRLRSDAPQAAGTTFGATVQGSQLPQGPMAAHPTWDSVMAPGVRAAPGGVGPHPTWDPPTASNPHIPDTSQSAAHLQPTGPTAPARRNTSGITSLLSSRQSPFNPDSFRRTPRDSSSFTSEPSSITAPMTQAVHMETLVASLRALGFDTSSAAGMTRIQAILAELPRVGQTPSDMLAAATATGAAGLAGAAVGAAGAVGGADALSVAQVEWRDMQSGQRSSAAQGGDTGQGGGVTGGLGQAPTRPMPTGDVQSLQMVPASEPPSAGRASSNEWPLVQQQQRWPGRPVVDNERLSFGSYDEDGTLIPLMVMDESGQMVPVPQSAHSQHSRQQQSRNQLTDSRAGSQLGTRSSIGMGVEESQRQNQWFLDQSDSRANGGAGSRPHSIQENRQFVGQPRASDNSWGHVQAMAVGNSDSLPRELGMVGYAGASGSHGPELRHRGTAGRSQLSNGEENPKSLTGLGGWADPGGVDVQQNPQVSVIKAAAAKYGAFELSLMVAGGCILLVNALVMVYVVISISQS